MAKVAENFRIVEHILHSVDDDRNQVIVDIGGEVAV
jgi:hypothetical protein